MILITHVLMAFASLAVTTYAYFRPSKTILRIVYALATMTLVSGSYLVIVMPAHLVHACAMGLVYFALVAFGIIIVRTKLARAPLT